MNDSYRIAAAERAEAAYGDEPDEYVQHGMPKFDDSAPREQWVAIDKENAQAFGPFASARDLFDAFTGTSEGAATLGIDMQQAADWQQAADADEDTTIEDWAEEFDLILMTLIPLEVPPSLEDQIAAGEFDADVNDYDPGTNE